MPFPFPCYSFSNLFSKSTLVSSNAPSLSSRSQIPLNEGDRSTQEVVKKRCYFTDLTLIGGISIVGASLFAVSALPYALPIGAALGVFGIALIIIDICKRMF
jgi:hypothetical protein